MNINIFIFFITINFSKALKLNKSKLSNTVNGFNLRKGSNVALVTPMFEKGKIEKKKY